VGKSLLQKGNCILEKKPGQGSTGGRGMRGMEGGGVHARKNRGKMEKTSVSLGGTGKKTCDGAARPIKLHPGSMRRCSPILGRKKEGAGGTKEGKWRVNCEGGGVSRERDGMP